MTTRPQRKPYRAHYFLIALVVLVVDQITKLLIVREIPLHHSVAVVPGFFSLSHVLNPGAAFSLFADSGKYGPRALIFFSCLVLTGITIVLWRSSLDGLTGLALSLIMGGATGNLLDRLRLGSVVDFLMFKLGSYYWPDFNVADSAIVIGSLLLVAELFFHKEADPQSAS